MNANLAMNIELVTRNTAEILTKQELENLLASKTRPSVYLGRAITGPLHMGHLVSLSKLLDLQNVGFETIVLLADIHAALDDLKSKWEDLEIRREYTRKAIELSVEWKEKPKFVVGSDFQLKNDYQMDIFKMSTLANVQTAMHAASEVTRMKNPKVSELIYPIMQALDEQYLGVDMQLGGLDQRHIMAFAREYMPKMGYNKNVELMMPLVPSLKGPGVKMSSSVYGSNIKVNASEEEIKKTIQEAYCPIGVMQDNPITAIVSLLILPTEGKLVIARDSKFGGDLEITSAKQLEEVYTSKALHPSDLKAAVTEYLIRKLARVRNYFESNKDLLHRLGHNFE
ncbi:MAG: tyrosine--tRNA ligase [Candidatus Marsarchaeota archaeon]|nr:tyrosine--tRNA ligase [Candidatus Marsarchaeota archaeon]MCL5112773.1 tyrosine--tRNA ligase [Candidatus Marsarchaeota archaeon]